MGEIKDLPYKVINGDMLKVLPTFEENTFDSCVTDPPYELTALAKRWSHETKLGVSEGTQYGRLAKGFMGQTWDGSGIAFNVNAWKEVYRVLKPGAYLLAFGGSRTFHRMAVAIEDAGFEIRDTIMWLYGSGSTGKATMFENRERNANYKIVMVELTKEYIPIIEARCDYALNKYEYDLAKEKAENEKKGILDLFDFAEEDL